MNDQDAADASPHGADLPTGTPGDTGPSTPVPDWRELLAAHRFGAARQAYLLSQRLSMAGAGALPGMVGADAAAAGRAASEDGQVGQALSALADVEELVRERSYLKAKTRLERLESRPLLAPWQQLQEDLDVLTASSKALDRRDPEAALESLAAVDDSWFEADVLTQRGTALIYLGELDEARPAFARALAIDPQHYRALTNLGNVALEQGEVDEAIGYYEQALKLNDQFANAHHNLGVAYRRKGHVGKSVRSLRRAQRVSQRVETVQARESFTRWSGKNSQKYLKWFLYAVAGGALWWILRSQGII
ncbi:MAG TPA: tetratricopeptide repeat protein [Trueperaceae bacterium]|nr:tetratricopeptide repeat protein [Trueperaceae bacterium]